MESLPERVHGELMPVRVRRAAVPGVSAGV
jgi:hypothetical protein